MKILNKPQQNKIQVIIIKINLKRVTSNNNKKKKRKVVFKKNLMIMRKKEIVKMMIHPQVMMKICKMK